MERSRSDNPLLKWVDPSLFGIFFLLACFASGVLFLGIGFGEGYFSRQLCFGRGCWEEFSSLFSLPLVVLEYSVKLIVAYSAAFGILVAVRSYLETKRVATSQVHLASRAAFEGFVSSRTARLRHLTPGVVSVDTWYSFMYPGSNRGDLELNPAYVALMHDIRRFVGRTDAFIEKVGRGYRHDRYQGPIMEKLLNVGIDISGTSRLDFFSLERESFQLINDVNRVFCADLCPEPIVPSISHGIP